MRYRGNNRLRAWWHCHAWCQAASILWRNEYTVSSLWQEVEAAENRNDRIRFCRIFREHSVMFSICSVLIVCSLVCLFEFLCLIFIFAIYSILCLNLFFFDIFHQCCGSCLQKHKRTVTSQSHEAVSFFTMLWGEKHLSAAIICVIMSHRILEQSPPCCHDNAELSFLTSIWMLESAPPSFSNLRWSSNSCAMCHWNVAHKCNLVN